eukprot:6188716-Pleurochrysis_carterae.AAC.2
MQEAVKVAIVVLWVGGALPPYTGLTCESIQPSSQTATLWLFVDSRHVAKVPEECLQVPNVRVVELGPHGVARRLASSLFDASKRARRADHSPRRRSGESWQQQLQRLMQTVPMESLSEYIPKASDELGNGHADWFTAFGASVIESYPKMLVELKPSWLWAVRSELLAAGHTHATFTDLDLVFGELSRWLTPELVWPFDVTTWGFEGDASRLFLRGQWTMIRLVGDGAEDLILRFTRCSYLSTRLLEYFEHRAIQHQANMLRGSSRASAAEENRELGLGRGRRLQLAEQAPVTSVPPTNYSRKELEEAFLMHRGPASASNSSIGAFMRGKLRGLLRQQLSYSYPALGMKVGECTTYDLMATDGQPLSAEGCYSCVMMTGKPTLRVRVVPAIFSDHLPGTVWWLQGRLSRLGEYPLQFSLRAQRQAGCSGRRAVAQYPANTTASADQLHCDAAEEVALVAGSGVALPLNTVQALGSKDRDNAAVAAFQSTPSLFLGANPSPGVHRTLHAKVHTGMSCRRLSWVGRTCPDARRCVRGVKAATARDILRSLKRFAAASPISFQSVSFLHAVIIEYLCITARSFRARIGWRCSRLCA